MKKIRLIGGPSARDLRILDCESGQPIHGVKSLVLHVEPGTALVAEVTQYFQVVGLDVAADVGGVSVVPAPDASLQPFLDAATVAMVSADRPDLQVVPVARPAWPFPIYPVKRKAEA